MACEVQVQSYCVPIGIWSGYALWQFSSELLPQLPVSGTKPSMDTRTQMEPSFKHTEVKKSRVTGCAFQCDVLLSCVR
jgi:hypothetical protein